MTAQGGTSNELKRLIVAFKRQVDGAKTKAEAAIVKIGKASYESYYEYREAIVAIEGVVVLIEDRIEHFEGPAKEKLVEFYNATVGDLLALKMDVVMRIFTALATTTRLPMGGKKVFKGTINDLDQARQMIDDRGFAHLLNDEARRQLDKARDILEEVARRAPKLMSLSDDGNDSD